MGRKEFWLKSIGSGVGTFFIGSILSSMGDLFGFLFTLAIIAVGVLNFYWARLRFHDVGLSGVWMLLTFVPFIGGLAIFIILLLPANTFDTYQKKHTATQTVTDTQTVEPTVNTVDTESEA